MMSGTSETELQAKLDDVWTLGLKKGLSWEEFLEMAEESYENGKPSHPFLPTFVHADRLL